MIEEVVADKGYHSRTTIHDLETLAIRTYIGEPDRGPQSWIDLSSLSNSTASISESSATSILRTRKIPQLSEIERIFLLLPHL